METPEAAWAAGHPRLDLVVVVLQLQVGQAATQMTFKWVVRVEQLCPAQLPAHLHFMQPVVVVLIAMELALQADQASEEMVEEPPPQLMAP
jgi:hypothetical protein